MTKYVVYAENVEALDAALEKIEMTFPCWVRREFIEMNYSKIEIKAREEDMASIERILAPYM